LKEEVQIDFNTKVSIINSLQNSDITGEEIDNFVTRWNNTVTAWNAGIYSPNEIYADIVDKAVINENASAIIEIMDYSKARGYESVSEMAAHIMEELAVYLEDNSQNSVCASVTLQISQKVAMTREAFRGTLSIYNGHESIPMEDVQLNLTVRDANGVDATNLFHIETESLQTLTEVNGTGSLAAESDGTATILFIPTVNAAPTVAKTYSFGGTLSYTDPFTGETVTADLFPVALEVHPSPNLHLHYFMQRDILGDDPLTAPVEPTVPADLALMIHNRGAGEAKNVMIESAQPKIIDNEKGLLVNFNIIGSSLGSETAQIGMLNVNFGNIQPQTAITGHWWITGSLLGHFVDYKAQVRHLDSRGNSDLSLVDTVEIHELIHSVTAYDKNDGIYDFLVNDQHDSRDLPDGIYYSDASYAPVHIADTAYADGNVTSSDLSVTLTVRASQTGWNYARMDDPAKNKYRLVQVTRSDGVEIPISNVWQTFVTLNDSREPVYEDKIHIADVYPSTGLYTYNLVFEEKNTNTLKVDSIAGLSEPSISYALPYVTVYFDRPIYAPSFTWEDLELHYQGGENLADSTLLVDSVAPNACRVYFNDKTARTGHFSFTVNTLDIIDMNSNSGYLGERIEWIQYVLTYNITYELNGGTDPGNPSTYTVADLPITLQPPTKSGYDFTGWTEGDSITVGSTGDKTFTAQWSAINYNIAYELNGGVNHEDNPATYTVEDLIVLKAPTKSGYDFTGWIEGDSITAGSTGDKTFTAQWSATSIIILTGFSLDNNANVALSRTVDLVYTFSGGVPREYIAGEKSDMSDSQWKPYNPAELTYSFASDEYGPKTVYTRLRNDKGETAIMSDVIYYKPFYEISVSSFDDSYDQPHSVGSLSETAIRIYPNPVETSANIAIDNIELPTGKVEVYSLEGKMYLSQKFSGSTFSLDMSSCPTGIFLVKLTVGDAQVTKRIIKL
jgi:uncharacterized repeat protein (TIGR02543 family)